MATPHKQAKKIIIFRELNIPVRVSFSLKFKISKIYLNIHYSTYDRLDCRSLKHARTHAHTLFFINIWIYRWMSDTVEKLQIEGVYVI